MRRIMTKTINIEQEIERIIGSHYYCEDSWYSCPLAPDGCANEEITECNCRFKERMENAKALLTKEKKRYANELIGEDETNGDELPHGKDCAKRYKRYEDHTHGVRIFAIPRNELRAELRLKNEQS